MPNFSIQHIRHERVTDTVEHLFMNATIDGQPKTVFVKVARAEKRPMFMIDNCAALCNYDALRMRQLLNMVVIGYANILDADKSEGAETI